MKNLTLREWLSLLRTNTYDHDEDCGDEVILCVEAEEWTHVTFNLNNVLLDLLGDLVVESVDAVDNKIRMWIKTDDFNWFDSIEQRGK